MSGGSLSAVAAGVSAAKITKASKSNLAMALFVLPKAVRSDMEVFYAFCRVVDDIADEPGMIPEERMRALERWRVWLTSSEADEPPLAGQVRAVIERHRLAVEQFEEIIFGCEMDVHGTVYETWDDLRLYCHRVASVVGLVSIGIFGSTAPEAQAYATELGLALQVTNIIRDVGEDYRNHGRIYLPRADMDEFGYCVGSLALQKEDAAYRALMEHEAARAYAFYDSAMAHLPAHDRKPLVAAGIMRRVYFRLLKKMCRSGLRTLSQRYRLSKREKMWCAFQGWLNPG